MMAAEIVYTSGQFSGNTISITGRFTGEDDGPTAGVREPRRPKPNRPQGAMEMDTPIDDEACVS